jgi:radical SAM superfamily enzyme YgiQ (UPF0313 family)
MPLYEEPLFRPPAEADSLIFQVARGCPHNTCRFCAMYKGVRYRIRPQDEILAEMAATAAREPGASRIFLADGDVMALPFSRFRELLEALNAGFPALSRVNVYANGRSILARSDGELAELRRLKLNTLYMGLETGDDALLQAMGKGETADGMVTAIQRAQAAGLRGSVMILLGLAGAHGSEQHADATAAALNRMQPRLLSALRFVDVPGTAMPAGYKPLSEYGVIVELIRILQGVALEKTVFRSNHTSNPIPLEGRLPRDRDRLVQGLQSMLPLLDRNSPGATPFFL